MLLQGGADCIDCIDNRVSSNSWSPEGLSRPVKRLLFFPLERTLLWGFYDDFGTFSVLELTFSAEISK
jgi:hypothetical protein